MDELIARIAEKAGVDAAVARKAAAIIVNFLSQSAPPDKAEALIDKLPGARDLAGETSSGGGGVMGAFNDLTAIGLGMGGINGVTREFVAYAREQAGDQAVDDVVNAIPGLSQFV